MIPTRNLIYYLYVGAICSALVLIGCRPQIIGPTKPSGYRIAMPPASQTARLQPLTLRVRVTDASGMPIDGVRVSFRLPRVWTAVASLDPPTALTHNGNASTTFQARVAGQVAVDIMVEDVTETVRITVFGETPRF